ncbi:SOS response-associated peptidase [Actinoallomurus sp. NBC_01490]|uniref:SOS response-associated peptidase n=1 Tax=Actinoallomurus sp. NBC_01490 TaxID=2903557 RepID=UPI002E331262|nr:SOS response-associated peptidase [Actinoallomurus sp. NBC_01490]
MCGRYASTRGRQELVDFFGVERDEADDLEPDYNVAPTKPVPVVLTRRSGSDAASGVGGEGRAARGASEERTRPASTSGSDAASGVGGEGRAARGASEERTRPGDRSGSDAASGVGGEGAGVAGAGEERARSEDVRELHVARWGLVPFWAKDVSIGARLINARVETAHEKPAFRRAFALHRCVVPADGYYEWQATDGGKQPHFIRPADGGILAMAGLYAVWRSPDAAGGRLLTCTILTTEATDDVGRIHDRMPMLVEPERFGAWLDPALTDPDEVRSLLVPAAEGRLESYPVSTAVNKVANNGPELVRPLPQMGIPSVSPLTLF